MKINILYTFLFVALFSTFSCGKKISNFEEYLTYLSQKENGIVKEKPIAGILLEVKYLPIEYLVYKDFKNSKKTKKKELLIDKLYKSYKNTLTFMFTLGPDENEKFDITRVGVSNYEEFAQRIELMNFNMTNFIYLEYNNTKIAPKLALMENSYGLENKRAIMVSFEVDDNTKNVFLKKHTYKFVYSDQLFNTGINKFTFNKEDINDLPEFEF